MKFHCTSRAERISRKHAWHRWFAWYPVRTQSECTWLEMVWRQGNYWEDWEGGMNWTYKYLDKNHFRNDYFYGKGFTSF